MRIVKYLAAAAAASLSPTALLAADLPIAQPVYVPPPDDFGGWYLRGDIGMSNQSVKRLTNVLGSAPGITVNAIHYDFDSAPTFSLGFGYQFNNWFRADITGEYRGKANFHGLEVINFNGAPIGTDEYRANKSEWLVLANVYADLGTWWSVTPFIGVGAGMSRTTISNFVDINTPTLGVAFAPNASKWQFAWAAYAGLAYRVSRGLTVELAYRYLNLGDGVTGDIATFDGINNVFNPTTFHNITSQDIKLGVRWSLESAPAYVPAPPLIRKG